LIAERAIAQGATLPPTQVNPSMLNKLLEGFSGKQQTGQVASIKNQELGNVQTRKFLNLAPDTPVDLNALQNFRAEKGLAYEALKANPTYYADRPFITDINKKTTELQKLANTTDVTAELRVLNGLKQMNFDGTGIVEQMKRLRYDGESNVMSADPANRSLGQAQKFAAKQLEELAARNLKNFGQNDVFDNFKEAQKAIGKSYTIEKSLNLVTGDVSLAKLGQRAAAGKIVPSELETLANAAAAYPTAFQNVARIGSVPGISPLDVGAAGVAAASASNPSLLATVLGRPAVRAGITSPVFQRNMLPSSQPQAPGLLNRVTSNPLTNYGLGQLPEYGTERFLLPR
jgi:hypothetical protein